jgi:hypothetical protein
MRIGKVNIDYYRKSPSYNDARSNPRTLEVPLGFYFLNLFKEKTFEVGAVMWYYTASGHKTLDLYDTDERCIREDAVYHDYTGKNVLSISTIEHIGHNNYKTDGYHKPLKDQEMLKENSFKCLISIMDNSKNYLITTPIGYNKYFDKRVSESNVNKIVARRINSANEWEVTPDSNDMNYSWGHPYGSANAICIFTNLKELCENGGSDK